MVRSLINDENHKRPHGVSDETVEAVGKVTEAYEWIERARGDLYEFHQKMGHADATFAEAADALQKAGHAELADYLKTDVVGRNVIAGRWTFQLVEEFDDGYYAHARDGEKKIRDELVTGKRHVYESELKEKTRTKDKSGHEATP